MEFYFDYLDECFQSCQNNVGLKPCKLRAPNAALSMPLTPNLPYAPPSTSATLIDRISIERRLQKYWLILVLLEHWLELFDFC